MTMAFILRFAMLAATMAVANAFAGVGGKATRFVFRRLFRR
jgi:hypothetical protein